MSKQSLYHVQRPIIPPEDLSGETGRRLLRLLSIQGERSLRWFSVYARNAGIQEEEFFIPNLKGKKWEPHSLYNAVTSVTLFAVLARFGEPKKNKAGVSREKFIRMSIAALRAALKTHPLFGAPETRPELWRKEMGVAARMNFIFGVGAWLLWDELDTKLQNQVAASFEYAAELFADWTVPHQLYDDTQGESNAWTGGGLALSFCALKKHPRRDIWNEKAKELMVSSFATEKDVTDTRKVDGKPLKEWLKGPNAFPDYTVENHYIIHPIYIAAISEMVRSTICYKMGGEAVPESATFNAEHVFDMLMRLNLPDGNHLYPQGTDYNPRRIDSFFQACNVIPLKPDPLREACFLRSLRNMELMAAARPGNHMNGDLFNEFDFCTIWGLSENYLMRRFFGSPAEAIPEKDIESHLTCVHVNEPGKFALHRTAQTLSSFSWHTKKQGSHVMGFTVPLEKDVLCFPAVGGYIGTVAEASQPKTDTTIVRRHHVKKDSDAFSVMMELERCEGKVKQCCSFVSLPDGRSIYMENRTSLKDITLASAESGSVCIYDDTRWPFQKKPRVFYSEAGTLNTQAGKKISGTGSWLNIDNRMGYAVLGSKSFSMHRSLEYYHTWSLNFESSVSPGQALRVHSGEEINCLAMVSCPWQQADDTALAAAELSKEEWRIHKDRVLAIHVNPYLVYANFTDKPDGMKVDNKTMRLASWSCGYILCEDTISEQQR